MTMILSVLIFAWLPAMVLSGQAIQGMTKLGSALGLTSGKTEVLAQHGNSDVHGQERVHDVDHDQEASDDDIPVPKGNFEDFQNQEHNLYAKIIQELRQVKEKINKVRDLSDNADFRGTCTGAARDVDNLAEVTEQANITQHHIDLGVVHVINKSKKFVEKVGYLKDAVEGKRSYCHQGNKKILESVNEIVKNAQEIQKLVDALPKPDSEKGNKGEEPTPYMEIKKELDVIKSKLEKAKTLIDNQEFHNHCDTALEAVQGVTTVVSASNIACISHDYLKEKFNILKEKLDHPVDFVSKHRDMDNKGEAYSLTKAAWGIHGDNIDKIVTELPKENPATNGGNKECSKSGTH